MAGLSDCFSAIDFARHGTVIAAVSGGSDSTALLVLAHEYLGAHFPTTKLAAVTIDHGLRPESAGEALRVAKLCARLGIQHSIKRWTGEKPATGIQDAAREARYRLLSDAASERGATLILTGHTLGDQFETLLMRQERGEGPGLAGIAPATLSFRDDGGAPIWFARPLLSIERTALRNDLTRLGIGWIDDPSNLNTDFERVRARQQLAGMGGESVAALPETQARWAKCRLDVSARVGDLISASVTRVAPGLFRIAPQMWNADDESANGALRIMMAFAGGSQRMIECEGADGIIARLRGGGPLRVTGSRALLDRRKQGLFLLREDRDVRADGMDFDGRYILGSGTASATPAAPLGEVPNTLMTHALQLEPPAGRQIIRHVLNPWPRRVPLFDLSVASALARLAGEPAFPPAPCSL